MKLTIAICDNEQVQVRIVSSYIELIDTKYNIEILEALDGEEMLNKVEKKRVDVAFLDVRMEKMDGIELGRRIRQNNRECIIIVITGFRDYALSAFDINAFKYILKPITQNKIKKCMNDVILRLEEKKALKEKNNIFTINNKKDVVILKYEDILYFEKLINKIRIHTVRDEYEYYGTLKKLKKELDMEKNFIQCHQGYIVNMSRISQLREGLIYIRDTKDLVPVSRRYKAEIRKTLEANLFC